MKSKNDCTSDIDELVGKLTADTVGCLYNMSVEPQAFRDWPEEVDEFKSLMQRLWAVCLSPLVKKLVSMCEARNGDKFRDHLFEALVAKKMLDHGAVLEYEPPRYGKSPPDFLARLGQESALVECVHPGGDLDEKLASTIKSALCRDPELSRAVQVVLAWVRPSMRRRGFDGCKAYVRHAAARVLRRAHKLEAGSECEMKLFCGTVVARIRRGKRSGGISVGWDTDGSSEAWLPPRAVQREQLKRVVALRDKAVKKFRGALGRELSGALRVLVVDRVGRMVNPTAQRVRRYLQCRKRRGAQPLDTAFRRYLDGMVFARLPLDARLVADLDFCEALVFTKEEGCRTRLRSLFSGLGWRPEYICCA